MDVFDDGPEGFTDEMVMATKACLDTINETDKVEQAIKDYYDTDIMPELEDDLEINDINQSAQYVQPKELYVTDCSRGLYRESVWDEERGIGIVFDEDVNIEEVGDGGFVY